MNDTAVDIAAELVEAKKIIKSQEELIGALRIDAENYKPVIERYKEEVLRLQSELQSERNKDGEVVSLRQRLTSAEQVISVLRGIIRDIAAGRLNDDYY